MRALRIRALVIKELLAVWRDKRSRIVLIGPPLLQLFIFSFAATLDVDNVTIAVLDRDHGKPAFELIQRLEHASMVSGVLRPASREEMARMVDDQEVILAVALDETFSRDVASGRTGKIQLILDGRRSNAAQIVYGYVSRIVRDMGADIALMRGADSPQRPAELSVRHWFNANLRYMDHTLPCLVGILVMIVSLIVTALSVAREREMGTFDQLLVSPLRPHEILIGKTAPALLIGFVEGVLIISASVFVFGVPMRGDPLVLLLGMLVFLLAMIGIGLFLSSLSRTQQQAILGAFTFMSPAVMLSGFATPVDNMPDWLQTFTLANPLRHFIVVSKGVFLKAMDLSVAWQSIWPMLLIAAGTLLAAGWLFGRKLE